MGNVLQNKITAEREINLEKLYCIITIGASGAVSSFESSAIKSVVKESTAGQYTLTLVNAGYYARFVHANITELHSSAEDLTFQVKSENVDDATTPVVVIQGKTAATEANTASGSKILVELILEKSV
jgi:hypothetical protein